MHDLIPEIRRLFEEVDVAELSDEQLVNLLLERSISVLAFNECLIHQFVCANFLGGHATDDFNVTALEYAAISNLTVEGEVPFKQAKHLGLFYLCKRNSLLMCDLTRSTKFPHMLVAIKCVYLHQYLIGQERSERLHTELLRLLEIGEDELESGFLPAKEDLTCFYLLAAYLCVFYYHYEMAEEFASKCAKHMQLSLSFSGALGKRTRFQQSDVANLFIKVDRTYPSNEEPSTGSFQLPKAVQLDDDTLLNATAFTSEEMRLLPRLSAEEQSLVLLLCELYRIASPRDDMADEQCLAYINAVLRQAYPESDDHAPEDTFRSCWPIATEALFRRSLIEHTSTRRAERSVSQLEELSNQFWRSEPPSSERCPQFFFFTRMPSIWVLQLEQARLLKKLGCYKSALDVFLRWNQWFDIIDCYTHLNKREKAEEVIRAQLASGDQSPELYCALGDVTGDRVHYTTAWEVSKHTSARAMRSMAVVHMYVDKDYEKAIECFEASLSINSLQVGLWFTFGCCCLQAKIYTKAENAFRRCVQLDPDNYEAWNNCASAAVLNGKKLVALKLLKEACKYNYENWRIWENISIISTDVGCFEDTIQACHRLLDLRNKFTDADILGVLSKAVSEGVVNHRGRSASELRSTVLTLFGRVTATTPGVAEIWEHYAALLLSEKPGVEPTTFQRAVQHLQTAHRCRLSSSEGKWEQSDAKRTAVVKGLYHWADVVLKAPDFVSPDTLQSTDPSDTQPKLMSTFVKSSLASLRLSIMSVLGRLQILEDETVDLEAQSKVRATVKELKQLLDSVETASES